MPNLVLTSIPIVGFSAEDLHRVTFCTRIIVLLSLERRDNQMKFPENLKYNREHLWVKVEDNTAYVGITDYAQDQLGEILYVDLPEEDQEFSKGDQFSEVESAKVNSTLMLPFAGTVLEVNEKLDDEPEYINEAPYDAWIAKFEVKDLTDLEDMINAAEYEDGLE
jgi:glycine cleavage system H protein